MITLLNGCMESSLESKPEFTGAINLNQVGFDFEDYKSAIVELNKKLDKLDYFVVLNIKNEIVYEGKLDRKIEFKEWGQDRQYLEADFSELKTPGHYSLAIDINDQRILSPTFEIGQKLVFSKTIKDIVKYFYLNRNTNPEDRKIRIIGTDRYVDVWGGWNDAGGDPGKYLSHLSYSNYLTPQQASFVVWSLFESYRLANNRLKELSVDKLMLEEAFWGADYLHRILDENGYFYATVFDKWGTPEAERLVTGYKGIEGEYTANYHAAFREGGGLAIAALANAARIANQNPTQGEFSSEQYLNAAEKGFAHLKQNNKKYCDDGKENIIDDYTALMASVELFKATNKRDYLDYARQRAKGLNSRIHKDGWFVSDDGERPYYSAVEAGLPIVALVKYMAIESDIDLRRAVLNTIYTAVEHQISITGKNSNPYLYARQNFKTFKDGKYGTRVLDGLFIPHANETGYWWQGENARLASLAAATVLAKQLLQQNDIQINHADYERFAQLQIDWILGRNPFATCMLYGFGANNPPYAKSGGAMIKGGISNGITGAVGSDEGRGIAFAEGPEHNNWRWVEQWTPHGAWFIYATSLMLGAAE